MRNTINVIAVALVVALCSGCLAEETDLGRLQEEVSDAAEEFYASVRRMHCLKKDGEELSCKSDGDCDSGKCDVNCDNGDGSGCCIKAPEEEKNPPKKMCRYLILGCGLSKSSSQTRQEGYVDENGVWHATSEEEYVVNEDPHDPLNEPSDEHDYGEPGDGHDYGETTAGGGDDGGGGDGGGKAACTCPAARASEGDAYFGPCLSDASTATTANCQYPPDNSGAATECVDQYCVYEMQVDASGCKDPTLDGTDVPDSYPKSECGGKSCKGNKVAICSMTGGTWVKKTDCQTLTLPSK